VKTGTPTPEPTLQPMTDFSEATFVYDGNGNMVEALPGNACGEFELSSNSRLNCISSSYVIDDVSTYYIGGYYELKVDGTTETETKYYSGPTGRFAMRVEGTLYWIFSDHLQSSSVILDEAGWLVSRTDYTAFGEVRAESGTSPTDYQYTGQRSYLDSFGLHYYVARWYDPVTAHFAQADSIIPQPGNSADWNRYAYVLYNPMRYIDPTGHIPTNMSLLQEQVEIEYYRYKITNLFGWDVSDINLTLSNLKNIFDAGYDIAQYVFKTCLGNWIGVDGIEWVKINLGNAIFKQNGSCFGNPCVPGKETIRMSGSTLRKETIVHELGHVLDNRRRSGAVWIGGGYSDELLETLGVTYMYEVRWLNAYKTRFQTEDNKFYTSLAQNKVLLNMADDLVAFATYGNWGPADYFADSFEFLVYKNGTVPTKTEAFFIQLVVDLAP